MPGGGWRLKIGANGFYTVISDAFVLAEDDPGPNGQHVRVYANQPGQDDGDGR